MYTNSRCDNIKKYLSLYVKMSIQHTQHGNRTWLNCHVFWLGSSCERMSLFNINFSPWESFMSLFPWAKMVTSEAEQRIRLDSLNVAQGTLYAWWDLELRKKMKWLKLSLPKLLGEKESQHEQMKRKRERVKEEMLGQTRGCGLQLSSGKQVERARVALWDCIRE